MAQTGYSKVQIYSSSTATHTPSAGNLTNDTNGSELAINITDGKLFYKDNSGTVQVLATKATALSTVTNNGVVYVNSSGQATTGSALVFDGSNLGVGVTPSAWSGFTALQMANGVGLSGASGSSNTQLTSNAYFNGSAWTYIANAYATKYTQVSGQHQWFNAPSSTGAIIFTQAMTLDNNGNLGLGTTSPNISGGASGSQVMTISATASGRNGLLELKGTRVNSGDVVSYVRTFNNSGSTPITDIQSIRGASDTTGSLAFFTSNTEAARIDSSGNLLVGTTSGNDKVVAYGNFGSTGTGYAFGERSTAANGSTSYFHQFVTNSGSSPTQAGSITWNGTVMAYGTGSDERLKENIVDAPSALSYVSQIQVRSFDMKASSNHVTYGVIAQELETVEPSAVAKGISEEEMWMVDTSVLVPAMIKAIQEQQAMITTLQTQVTALQTKVGV